MMMLTRAVFLVLGNPEINRLAAFWRYPWMNLWWYNHLGRVLPEGPHKPGRNVRIDK